MVSQILWHIRSICGRSPGSRLSSSVSRPSPLALFLGHMTAGGESRDCLARLDTDHWVPAPPHSLKIKPEIVVDV